MLKTDPVILPVINLFNGRSAVEETLILAGNGLGEVTQPIPLATLFWKLNHHQHI